MALKIKNYELPDKSILPEAYMRIQNVLVENRDYEYFKPSDTPDVLEELAWTTRIVTTATVFVWADDLARKNRAKAEHWFTINLNYDLSEHTNVFEQVYDKLKTMFSNSENV